MATTQALQPVESAALVSSNTSLPSIAEMRQRMTWLAEFRPVLLEYVQKHMDPKRHMYSFDNNRYTPMTLERLEAMMSEGQKPALNQDGIHNLMSLYDCYPDEPTIHESREDGHYTCRATLRLISFRSGLPMGAGTGSCSTRETKYAYRWVGERDIPKGVNKTALKSREYESRNGKYTRYRLDNEDVADVEATVLQMAVKRAKSSAVKGLPLVSEMFAALGDPDEEKRQEDEARQELLQPLGQWLKSMKAAVRAKAILAVFGEPLRPDDVAKLDEDRLAVAWQVVEIATKRGVPWESPTLIEDLKRALQTSAEQAKADLFGDSNTGTSATMPETREKAPHAAQEPRTGVGEGVDVVDTPQRNLEGARGQNDSIAYDTLVAHQADPALPADLLERIAAALSPLAPATESEMHALASVVLDYLDGLTASEPQR